MHVTRAFKSSPHCVPSPDGALVATLFTSKIHVRSVESLDIAHTVTLPSDVSGPIYSFQWSPSSSRLLVALVDHLHVFSALEPGYHAAVRIAPSSNLKPSLIQFGATDDEICVLHQFGIKFVIFDLRSSKCVEILNPKFHHVASAKRGFAFRSRTGHLVLLTRSAGKDVVSIHHPSTRELQRSWNPDTVDAQGMQWTPDGRWLVIWDSASQGHKLLFYTPDGHLFKAWSGPSGFTEDTTDYELGAGVKSCQFSPDSKRAVVSDHTRSVWILEMDAVIETLKLEHPITIVPRDTLQIWQEQVNPGSPGSSKHSFVRAVQTVAAPTPHPPAASGVDSRTGSATAVFDASSNLLATQLEDSPSTVWIWDLGSSELRSVVIFHRNIKRLTWHPSIRELLMITCEGDDYAGLVFLWDPLLEGPRTFNLVPNSPSPKLLGKSHCSWIDGQGDHALCLFSGASHYVMASLAGPDHLPAAWQQEHLNSVSAVISSGLGPSADLTNNQCGVADGGLPMATDDEIAAVDDTFSFRQP